VDAAEDLIEAENSGILSSPDHYARRGLRTGTVTSTGPSRVSRTVDVALSGLRPVGWKGTSGCGVKIKIYAYCIQLAGF
jgi:hypothetical protein